MGKMDEIASTSHSSTKAASSDVPAKDEDQGKKNAFHVDTELIPQASLEEQNSELNALGLSVFNQDVFEEGVMNQVDEAMAKEEKIRLHKILVKELNTINDDIKLVEKDLARVEAAVSRIEDLESPSREAQRELDSVRRQQANKAKQLNTLSVRHENTLKKIKEFERGVAAQGKITDDSSTFEQAFQVQSNVRAETDKQRMLRLGEMTPFGTVIKKHTQPKPKPIHLSEFEKVFSAKEAPGVRARKDFNKYLKKKSLQSKLPPRSGESSTIEEGELIDDIGEKSEGSGVDKKRRDRQARKRERRTQDDGHETNRLDGEDEAMDSLGEEEEYLPSKDDDGESSDEEHKSFSDNSEDGGIMGVASKRKPGKKAKFKRKRPRPLPVYRENDLEEEEPVRTKVKRDFSIRREKDDADPEAYHERLFKNQKLEAKNAKKNLEKSEKGAEEEDEEDDEQAEFEGGLQVPKELWKKLYHYQRTGVRWLWELHLQQAGGIVGDEMGLGKTIQTIAFLAALRTSRVRNVNFPYKGLGPSIIICPTTVMHQWVKECHKWWPEFRVAILHSSGSFVGSESDMVRSIAKSHGILVTSFNTLVIHQELILRFNWHYVILDEGHKIRNPDAKVTLCCKQFRTPHRIILSGSPIQNNLKELWSLFDFVFPGKLGTLPDFMQHFSVPIVQGGYSNATQIEVETAYRCACVLRDTINPYLIRRMKADVKGSINLPGKNEQVLFCRITDEQRGVYEEYLSSRECNAILNGKFKVFAGLITLRKVCNHPDLSTGGPQVFKGEQPLDDDPELEYGFWRRSGKMIVVEALLRLWKKQDCRVLLFTQSKAMLTILAKFVQGQGYSYLTMDGTTTIGARQPLIDQYNNDKSIYLFLLTTKVGGLGVNLTGADRVIIYDPDWNPSTDMQARERAWRIGQKKQVTIYRLLTSGTIEEKIYHRQIFKQFLTNRILKDPKQRRLFQSQHMYDLFTLGSKDNKEGTETSALFAGTGCNVKIPPKQRRLNRFDEINKRKEEEKNREKEERNSDVVETVNVKQEVDNGDDDNDMEEEMNRMKELARKLSRKMEEEKKKKLDVSSQGGESINDRLRPVGQGNGDAFCETEDGFGQALNGSNEGIPSIDSHNSTERKSDIQTTSLQTFTVKDERLKGKDKKFKIPHLKKSFGSEADLGPSTSGTSGLHRNVHDDDTYVEKRRKSREDGHHGDEGKPPEKKKKKKHRDARFEGEKIPHLVKQRALQQQPDNTNPDGKQKDQEDRKQQDDFVLRELFKKTGIEGAMKHDKIVDSSRPDYAIVEAEAQRVAKEAAVALKRSRRQCLSALSGEPTWTGQNGSLASRPRFGQKKNSLLVNKTDKVSESTPSPSSTKEENNETSSTPKKTVDKEKLFDGSMSGSSSLNSKDNSLTSNDLLSKIRSRKRISTAPVQEEDEDDEFLRPDVHQTLDPTDEELLSDIRNYVSFMATTDGQASTQEIVLNFGKRLPKSDAPKFKAMLKQICDHDCGVWRLKAEFR